MRVLQRGPTGGFCSATDASSPNGHDGMTFNRNKLRFAVLMSWRETRAAAGKFAFLVLAIALGTGALTAVTGFNASVRHTLSREARSLMAADISVRLPLRPPQSDLDTIKDLESEG